MKIKVTDWTKVDKDKALNFIFQHIGLAREGSEIPIEPISETEFKTKALEVSTDYQWMLLHLITYMHQSILRSTEESAKVISITRTSKPVLKEYSQAEKNILALHLAVENIKLSLSSNPFAHSGWGQTFKKFNQGFPRSFTIGSPFLHESKNPLFQLVPDEFQEKKMRPGLELKTNQLRICSKFGDLDSSKGSI